MNAQPRTEFSTPLADRGSHAGSYIANGREMVGLHYRLRLLIMQHSWITLFLSPEPWRPVVEGHCLTRWKACGSGCHESEENDPRELLIQKHPHWTLCEQQTHTLLTPEMLGLFVLTFILPDIFLPQTVRAILVKLTPNYIINLLTCFPAVTQDS